MKKKRYTPEQIIEKLREAEVRLSKGESVGKTCRSIGVSEQLLDKRLMQEPHSYMLEWDSNKVNFFVDGEIVSKTNLSPSGMLGFVAWIDNQYAVVTPQGNFGAGVVDLPGKQSLIIEYLTVKQT